MPNRPKYPYYFRAAAGLITVALLTPWLFYWLVWSSNVTDVKSGIAVIECLVVCLPSAVGAVLLIVLGVDDWNERRRYCTDSIQVRGEMP